MHLDTLQRLVGTALRNGGIRKDGNSMYTYEWDISGNCLTPVITEHHARPEADAGLRYVDIGPGTPHPIRLIMTTPCRKCDRCLARRRALWSFRAKNEVSLSVRTWFGTLTLSPENHHLYLSMARERMSAQDIDFDTLDPKDQFALRHQAIGVALTKWLKRIRKESGARLRYLLVAEAHKSGLPHYHILVHERSGQVGERTLRQQWTLGFSKFNIVNETSQATYVCKYLSKTAAARVRASAGYGQSP